MLTSVGFTGFTIYYAYDLPGALNYALGFPKSSSATRIGILYLAYSVPNMLLPYLFGSIAARFRYALLFILAFTVSFGQLIFTMGVYLNRFSVMITGRAVMGIGGESYSIIQNMIISERFKITELSGAMTFHTVCAKMGTVLSFIITPMISGNSNTMMACVFSLALTASGCISTYNFCTRHRQADLPLDIPEYQVAPMLDEGRPREPVEIRQLTGVESPFRLIMLIHFIIGCAWSPFYNVAPMIFQTRFKMDASISSYSVSFVEVISLMVTAIISYLIGNIGNNLNLALVGCCLLLLSHLNMVLYTDIVLRSIVLLGLASSLIYLYLPCMPKIVEKEDLPLTFALLCCGSNVAFSVSPLCVAALTTRDSTYLLVEVYIVILSFVGLVMLILLSYMNVKHSLGLNKVV